MNRSFMALNDTARYSKHEAFCVGYEPTGSSLRFYVYTDAHRLDRYDI